MKRRDFLRGVVAGGAAGALLTEGSAISKPTPARTKTRKLILNRSGTPARAKRPTARGLLFDLQKDPLEMTNVFDDPSYQDDVRKLTQAVRAWGPKGALPKPHVNESAPVIKQPNVPGPGHGHRQAMIEYCRRMMKKMKASQAGT